MVDAPRIVFLDDDHVIRLARFMLGGPDAVPVAWARDFFRPEDVDIDALLAAGERLRADHGAQVLPASGDPAERDRQLADAAIVIFRRGSAPRALFENGRCLKLVQRLGERADGIDLDAAEERGIWVSCLPRRTLHYTAEHAILLMLALAKRLLPADEAVRQGRFDPAALQPAGNVSYNWPGLSDVVGLHGRTLGIVGLGEVGTLVARLAAAFGMRILYTKRQALPPEQERALGASFRSLPDLMAAADFISIHAANVPEAAGFVGRQALAAMKPTAFLVNTSRGALVDEDALYEALAEGRIAGAGLDVHAIEPRPGGDRFAALPNVVLTPHVAGGSRLGVVEEISTIIDNCRAVLEGRPPAFQVRRPTGAAA